MIAIRLDKEIEQELDLLAKSSGSNRSAVVREAILRYLEDNEDLELAKQANSRMRSSKSLAQVIVLILAIGHRRQVYKR